jgi:predicted aspartyl protease
MKKILILVLLILFCTGPVWCGEFEINLELAGRGEVQAQSLVGYAYLIGLGVTQNYTKAAYWYKKAAKQGNAEAQYNLGVMYYNGDGVEQNYKLSYVWDSLAAAQGDKDAISSMAIGAKELSPQELSEAQELASAIQYKIDKSNRINKSDKPRETSVLINGNQILVPVRLACNGREIRTFLILDTGATATMIHDDFANKFKISDYKHSKSMIADGSIVDTKITRFDYIIVGPHRMSNFRVDILDYKGSSGQAKGLLGMNFLKNINYEVDYSRNVIKWSKK